MLRMATDKLKIRVNPPHPSHPRSIPCDNCFCGLNYLPFPAILSKFTCRMACKQMLPQLVFDGPR